MLMGNRPQLKINFGQVGLAEPQLDEMDHGVLAEEEEHEGSGPTQTGSPPDFGSQTGERTP